MFVQDGFFYLIVTKYKLTGRFGKKKEERVKGKEEVMRFEEGDI
jgi:hypothetical protein